MQTRLHHLAAALAATVWLAAGVHAAPPPAANADTVAAAVAAAPGVTLRLSYENRSIGNDGVTRDSRHSDLMVRRAGVVWIERELPAVLRENESHGHTHAPGPHAGHAHNDAQGAPLLLRRGADGTVAVQVVLHNQKRVIDVELGHHGNVGYGGSWAGAYWLIDPASLKRMEVVGPARNGVQSYRLRQGERVTLVDWDIAGHYARRIEQKDGHGLSSQRMTATPVATPKPLPWDALGGYARGDYSDLLD
jgi:hypothetical protein